MVKKQIKHILLILFVGIFSLWGQQKLVQLHVLPSAEPQELVRFFSLLKDNGTKGVIVRMFHKKGDRHLISGMNVDKEAWGSYYPIPKIPTVFNIGRVVAEAAQESGLAFWLWIPVFDWGGVPQDSGLCGPLLSYPKREIIGALDPFNPYCRLWLEDMWDALAKIKSIDGVLLQDDHILTRREGAGGYLEKNLANPKKRFALNTSQGEHWQKGKSRLMADLVRKFCFRIKKNFGSNFPIAINVPYDPLIFPPSGQLDAAFYWEFWKDHPVDFIALMLYDKQLMAERSYRKDKRSDYMEMAVNQWTNLQRSLKFRPKLLLKLQWREYGEANPRDDVKKLIIDTEPLLRLSSGIIITPFEAGDSLDDFAYIWGEKREQ